MPSPCRRRWLTASSSRSASSRRWPVVPSPCSRPPERTRAHAQRPRPLTQARPTRARTPRWSSSCEAAGNGSTASPLGAPDGRAPYLQIFLGPFLRQLLEQQSAFAVQVAPDGKHAGSVVVVLLVDVVVVVVVAGTVVVVVGDAVVVVVVIDTVVVVVVDASLVVVVVPGKVVVVVVLGRVVVVVVLVEVVVVLVGPAAASRFRASKLPSP